MLAAGKTMTDGTVTGLVDAATVVKEANEKRAAAKARIERLGDETSGRNAVTAVRDKATGRILTAEEVATRELAKNATPAERERPVWATGVAQAKQIAEGRKMLAEEADNPFARSDIDERADAAMREAERFGDPMAYLARRRTQTGGGGGTSGGGDITLPSVVEGISEEALKKSGFRIPQEVPAHSWLRRRLGAAPNRYGIKPGRHWDGVDQEYGVRAGAVQDAEPGQGEGSQRVEVGAGAVGVENKIKHIVSLISHTPHENKNNKNDMSRFFRVCLLGPNF